MSFQFRSGELLTQIMMLLGETTRPTLWRKVSRRKQEAGCGQNTHPTENTETPLKTTLTHSYKNLSPTKKERKKVQLHTHTSQDMKTEL